MARKKEEKNKIVEVDKTVIDTGKIAEDIKKQVLDEIDEEVIKRVDCVTQNKLDKMEKRIYKHKNLSIIKRDIIIILFLVVIVIETKVLYDNDLLNFKKDKVSNETNNELKIDKEEQENEKPNEIIKDSKWYIENYSYLLDNIKTNLTDKYYLYKENYNEDTMLNNVKLNMSYQLLDDKIITIENNVINIKESDLKDAYKEIFGSDEKYKGENFSNDCIQFIYNSESKNYMAINTTCENKKSELVQNIQNIYEENNNIIIETIVGIKEENKLNNIDGMLITDNYSNNLDNYKDKLNKYKYVFELKEEKYYFKSINKI